MADWIRKQFLFSEELNGRLRKAAFNLTTTESHLVRKCIDRYLYPVVMEELLERELERVGAGEQIESVRFIKDPFFGDNFFVYRGDGRSYWFEPNALQKWLEEKSVLEYVNKDLIGDYVRGNRGYYRACGRPSAAGSKA